MLIKQKLLNAISTHPKLVIIGIGLGLSIAVGAALGMFETHTAFASTVGQTHDPCGSIC